MQGQRQALGLGRRLQLALAVHHGLRTALALAGHQGQAGRRSKSDKQGGHHLGLPQPGREHGFPVAADREDQALVHRQVGGAQGVQRNQAQARRAQRVAGLHRGRQATGQVQAEGRAGARHVQPASAWVVGGDHQRRAFAVHHRHAHVGRIGHRLEHHAQVGRVQRGRQQAVKVALRIEQGQRQVQRVDAVTGHERCRYVQHRRVGLAAHVHEVGPCGVVTAGQRGAVASLHAAVSTQPLHGMQAGYGFAQGLQLRFGTAHAPGGRPGGQVAAQPAQGGMHPGQLAGQVLLDGTRLHAQAGPLQGFGAAPAVVAAPGQGRRQQDQGQQQPALLGSPRLGRRPRPDSRSSRGQRQGRHRRQPITAPRLAVAAPT